MPIGNPARAALNLDQPRVLVLNGSYEPLQVCSIKRGVTLVLYGVAEVLEQSEEVLHSPSTTLAVPSVIRLRRYIRRPRAQPVPFTRRNLLRRDGYTCQYCGSQKDLTIDHVLPRSRGGEHSWTNVVAACRPCNQRKGDRTPQEAGLSLRNSPKAPSFGSLIPLGISEPNSWIKYI